MGTGDLDGKEEAKDELSHPQKDSKTKGSKNVDSGPLSGEAVDVVDSPKSKKEGDDA